MKNSTKYFIFSVVSAFLLPLNAMEKQPPKPEPFTLTSKLSIDGINTESISNLNANLNKFNQNIETQVPKLIDLTNNIESHFFVGAIGLIGFSISLGFTACCGKSILDNLNNNNGDKHNNTTMSIGTVVGTALAIISIYIIKNRNGIAKYFSAN